MEFDWDPAKERTRVDDRQDYGENRHISLGALSTAAVVVVIHTERGDKIRLISARNANHRERKVYYDHLAQAQKGH